MRKNPVTQWLQRQQQRGALMMITLSVAAPLSYAQTDARNYSSINPRVDYDTHMGDVTTLNLAQLFMPVISQPDGLEFLAGRGNVSITMYQYDERTSNGLGLTLFKMSAGAPTSGIAGEYTQSTTWAGLDADKEPALKAWNTNNVKLAALTRQRNTLLHTYTAVVGLHILRKPVNSVSRVGAFVDAVLFLRSLPGMLGRMLSNVPYDNSAHAHLRTRVYTCRAQRKGDGCERVLNPHSSTRCSTCG